jgi:hypothetical protein
MMYVRIPEVEFAPPYQRVWLRGPTCGCFVLQTQESGEAAQQVPGGCVQVSRGIQSARSVSGSPLLQRGQVGGRGTSLHCHK